VSKLADLIGDAVRYRFAHMEQRHGQAHFNGVHAIAPEIADVIRGTEADPFYDDSRVTAFWQRVAELLG
jgi:hypothetical protein